MRISPLADDDDDLIEATPPGPPPGDRLSDHTARSGFHMDGLKSVLAGAVFAWIGSKSLMQVVLGSVIISRTSSGDPPAWVAASSGLLLFLIGAFLLVHGARAIRRRSRSDAQRDANPREPWVWDHPWSSFGSRDDSSRAIAARFRHVVFMALLLVPVHWGFHSGDESDKVLLVAMVIVDVMLLATLARIGYLVVRRMKYGVHVLRFRRFPFHTGSVVEVSLARLGPLAQFQAMHATLRCVQERFETRQRGRKQRTRTVCYELWSEMRRSEEGEKGRPAKRDFTWRFTVPEGLPGTSLSETPSRYWELEVTAEGPGVDYGAVFLIPVYEAPGAKHEALLAG